MDRGDWWATVHGVTKSRTRLSDFTFTFTFCSAILGPGGDGHVGSGCDGDVVVPVDPAIVYRSTVGSSLRKFENCWVGQASCASILRRS